MHRPRLGHAVIVNNVATEQPGSNVDVTALKAAYERVGFDVHVHDNCDTQVNVMSLASLFALYLAVLFTGRQRSCEKVIFQSSVSVCSQMGPM